MHDKQKQQKPLDARKTFQDVMTDEEFIPNLEKYNGNMQRAFAMTAMALVDLGTSKSGYRSPSVDRLHVAYTLDGFVSAKTTLDAGKHHPSQTKRLKTEAIAFNHAISRMIDNDPGREYDEVVNYLNDMYRTLRPRETEARYAYVKRGFEDRLYGMTQEIIAVQLADHLGYEVRDEVTVDEELKGIDEYYKIDNTWEGIDVKSSEEEAAARRRKDWKGHYIVTTGVPKRVIGSRFRLDSEEVAYYAEQFQEQLDSERTRVTELRQANSGRYYSSRSRSA